MRWQFWLLALFSVALLIGAVMVAGGQPVQIGQTFLHGSLGDSSRLTLTLVKTTPLLLAGLAVFLGLRAGLFNIGVEGQLVVGALACAAIGSRIPGLFGLGLGVSAGIVTGALWALPAGLIKAYRNGHEVITTIMLNSVAGFLTLYLASGPLKAPGKDHPTTDNVLARVPDISLGNLHFNVAVIVGVLGAFVLARWLRRSIGGYELEAVGQNPTAAEYAGVDRRKVIWQTMAASGAIAGLAGAVQVCAFEGRFYPEISSGIGFDALGVALLAGNSPIGVIASSFGFGVLSTGGTAIAIDGVPKGITGVVTGLLIIVAAAWRYAKVVRPV
jgi:simple sugar transport system permease protein